MCKKLKIKEGFFIIMQNYINMISVRIYTLEVERLLMKKNKKILKKILILGLMIYATFTLVKQQQTLNQYEQDRQDLSTQIEEQKEYKEELAKKKEDVDSLDFIEQTAREKLDMYYPNEKVYVDTGM